MTAFEYACNCLHKRTKMLLLRLPKSITDCVIEIVLRRSCALYVVCPQKIIFVGNDGQFSQLCDTHAHTVSDDELEEAVLRACGYSIYAHKKELANGFISIGNGCRMAISGFSYSFNNTLVDLSAIEAVRIRIAREKDCNTDFLFRNGQLCSTLVAGSPAAGKTTLLRNIAKVLSDGTYGQYYRVCVVDERNEIYPNGMSRPPCADVLTGLEKTQGILRAVRLCAPQVIICDEIGTLQEANCILGALNTGVRFICSIHAKNFEELLRRQCYRLLHSARVFDRIVLLDGAYNPGHIARITDVEDIFDEVEHSDLYEHLSHSSRVY